MIGKCQKRGSIERKFPTMFKYDFLRYSTSNTCQYYGMTVRPGSGGGVGGRADGDMTSFHAFEGGP